MTKTPGVNIVQSILHMIQGDPKFMRRVNGWFTIFWILMIPLSLAMGWLKSVEVEQEKEKMRIRKRK
jgi:preprotein translocase subunit SecG